jgi:hypothetical protein
MNVNQSTVLRIWSTVPEFDPENYMEVKPAQHCILINPSSSDQVAELRMGMIHFTCGESAFSCFLDQLRHFSTFTHSK